MDIPKGLFADGDIFRQILAANGLSSKCSSRFAGREYFTHGGKPRYFLQNGSNPDVDRSLRGLEMPKSLEWIGEIFPNNSILGLAIWEEDCRQAIIYTDFYGITENAAFRLREEEYVRSPLSIEVPRSEVLSFLKKRHPTHPDMQEWDEFLQKASAMPRCNVESYADSFAVTTRGKKICATKDGKASVYFGQNLEFDSSGERILVTVTRQFCPNAPEEFIRVLRAKNRWEAAEPALALPPAFQTGPPVQAARKSCSL